MIKLLIGGSPCTFWSIAQKNGRETEAEGMGWELFKNYLIAKEKFKPDFFLYENNKSAAKPIKEQISRELGVDLMHVNSALVSAQNRERFYAFNWEVEQPEDRGILLRDVLESRTGEIPYELQSVGIGWRGRQENGKWVKRYESNGEPKANALTTAQTDSMIAEPVGTTVDGKAYCLTASYRHDMEVDRSIERAQRSLVAEPVKLLSEKEMEYMVRQDRSGRNHFDFGHWHDGNKDKSACVTANTHKGVPYNVLCEPVRIGDIGSTAQAHRVYSCDGKSVTINAGGGGQGGKTGLYLCPVVEDNVLSDEYYHGGFDGNLIGMVETPMTARNGKQPSQHCRVYSCEDKSMCLGKDSRNRIIAPYDGKTTPVYEVKNGLITVKGKQYPIKLADGYYIIRKLTPIECERLQTLPDGYTEGVSNTQRYKALGNGWTAEVIIHLLNGALKNVPRDEEIVVLSMYDGIATGRYCLDKMGFTNVKYYAYEIDKYAKQVALKNYPDIIHCGDAFDVRHPDWTIGY